MLFLLNLGGIINLIETDKVGDKEEKYNACIPIGADQSAVQHLTLNGPLLNV